MKYCRNRIIDRKIKEYTVGINYWTHMQGNYWDLTGSRYSERAIKAYHNAVRRLKKLKKQ